MRFKLHDRAVREMEGQRNMRFGRFRRAIAISVAIIAMVFCMSLFGYAEEAAAPYVATVYNEQNGLPTGEANTVLQTSDGYIWIGSYGGLIRYNGSEFRNYSVENAIVSSSIRSLFEDSEGRLWIGTNDVGVVVMEDNVFTEIASPEDNSFLCVRGFAEDADGRVYAASNSGIAEIADGKIIPYQVPEVMGNTVYAVAVDSRNRVWGCMNNGACAVVKDGALVDIVTSDRLLNDCEIYSVAATKDGRIVLGTSSNCVAVLDFKSDSLAKEDIEITTYSTGEVTTHNSITASKSGHILASGINGMAVIGSDGSVTEFGENERAMSVNVSVIDYENDLWLASSAYGIIKYSRGCFTSPNDEAQLENVTLNTVAFAAGNCYIGTDTGLIICDKDWKRVENIVTEKFEGVRIRCIIVDDDENVWLASYSDFALVCYNTKDGTITEYSSAAGLVGDKARVVAQMSDGRIVLGTQSGVSVLVDGVITENYDYNSGMSNPSVLCFGEGENGEILVGSDGDGIYEIKDGKVTNHGFSCGLGEGVVLRMLKNSDGEGWFVSAGSSLYYWTGSEFTRLTNFAKGAGSIFEFYDKDGMLWILQNNGIMAVDKEQLLSGVRPDPTNYGYNHGMTGSLNANTWHWLDDDGTLYLATRNGISEFRFKGVENILPVVMIDSVTADGKVSEQPAQLKLDSTVQRITIDFSALSFTDTTELRLAYQLKGFDEVNILDSKSSSISYTNLPGGNYVFEAWAYNPENPEIISKVTLPISKEKTIIEQPLFWIVFVVLVVLLAFWAAQLVGRARLNQIKRRQQEYKNIVVQSLQTFANAIDAKDPYTNGHSIRVAHYSREIARRMGMTEEQQENIYFVALLHDIGKIGIPVEILNKPAKLTVEERAVIQRHVEIGGDILKDFSALEGISEGAKYHHERYDGTGYTKGIEGEDIPILARIIGVADTYDAMASDRCYRKALSKSDIIEEFVKCTGTQFDPDIVKYILDMIDDGTVPLAEDER